MNKIEQLEKDFHQLQERLSELKNNVPPTLPFEAGKWYKNKTGCLFFITKIDHKNEPLGFGFDYEQKWLEDSLESWSETNIRPASPIEIKDALVKEAVRRGLVPGVVLEVYECSPAISFKSDMPLYDYEYKIDALECNGTRIYKKGIWAVPKKYEPLKIGTYEVEFIKGYVKVGCKHFTNEFVKMLHDEMVSNELPCVIISGANVTLDLLTKIVERIK